MQNRIETEDFTGSIFATHWLYAAPMVAWYEIGEQYEIAIRHQTLGTAVCMGLKVYSLAEITSNITMMAAGKQVIEFKRYMRTRFGAEDNTPIAVMTMHWLDMDCAILRALMTERFEAVKGKHPHTKGAHNILSLLNDAA